MPYLPPTVDRPDDHDDRGSNHDDDDDNDNDRHDDDNSTDHESDYDRIRRQRQIDKNNERPTRVGTYGRNPPRAGRDNPNYAEIIIEDVNNQSFEIDINDKLGDLITPESYEQASNSDQKIRWLESMKKEITDLLKHKTWELVSIDDIPKGRKITKSRWVYAIKYNRDGSVERFKSRFVVCGYSQVKGFDYDLTFSATLRATSFRMLMAIAAGEKLKLDHFDVTSAFTQSKIDAEIYVEPPKGFITRDKNDKPMMLKLKKALYGTKQASRLWQETLTNYLIKEMGFIQCKYDTCLYIKRKGEHMCILGVYVDDIILAHNGDMLNWFKDKFTGDDGFNAKHLGKLSWFLGMAIDQSDKYIITINQAQYIDKLIKRFMPYKEGRKIEMSMPCNPTTFQQLTIAQNDNERARAKKLPYLELIGSLLYLSTMTRPDIAYHMSVLCSFMHDPSCACFDAAMSVLLFVHGTNHYHLSYNGINDGPSSLPHLNDHIKTNKGLIGYSDASWHKSDELGYDMFGYCIFMYGGLISFAAKRLKVIALSSAEAEYAAASYTSKEVMFVRNVCDSLGIKLNGPTILAVDNEAAIKIADNRGVTARNKHFQDAVHYIRHLIDFNYIKLAFVRTNNQRADGFTKPLAKPQFREWCKYIINGVSLG